MKLACIPQCLFMQYGHRASIMQHIDQLHSIHCGVRPQFIRRDAFDINNEQPTNKLYCALHTTVRALKDKYCSIATQSQIYIEHFRQNRNG